MPWYIVPVPAFLKDHYLSIGLASFILFFILVYFFIRNLKYNL